MSESKRNTLLIKTLNWAAIAFLVYLVLVAVGTVSGGFKLASGGTEGLSSSANAGKASEVPINKIHLPGHLVATGLLNNGCLSTQL